MWQIPVGVGVGVLYSGQSPKKAATATGLTLAGTALIRAVGWKAAGQTAWFAIRAVGAMSIQGFTGAVVGGAIVGTGVSYALFGKEGAKDAIKLYTGQVNIFDSYYGVPYPSLDDDSYLGTIAQAPERIAASIEANRAVANNAAGIPEGMPIDPSSGQPQGFNSPSGRNPFDTPFRGPA